MKNSSIKNEYLKKIKLLHKYNKAYFDESRPLISDQKFVFLKYQIIDHLLMVCLHQNMPYYIYGVV